MGYNEGMSHAASKNLGNTPHLKGRRSIPAWGMSCGFHVILVLILALVIRSQPGPAKGIEADRSVAIVIAKMTPQNTEYFAESKEADKAQQSPSQSRQALPPPPQKKVQKLLPNLKLPGAQSSAVNSDSVKLPDLTSTGGPQTVLPGQGTAEILANDAKLKRKGPTGATTQLSVFGSAPATGRSFVFVIDRSKSMGNDGLGALDAAGKELTRGLRALKAHNKFQIIGYHQTCTYFEGTSLLLADADRVAKVDGWLRKLIAFGSTEHTNGLVSAIRLKPDVIFLLTDGGVPELDSVQLRRIRRYAGGKISIHSIQFGSGPLQENDNFLKQLSRQNSGSFRYVDMAKWGKK